jgi:ketol-acid reductoisomerase
VRIESTASNAAEYGDMTRGNRIIINQESREAMCEILLEIQSGGFARDWI